MYLYFLILFLYRPATNNINDDTLCLEVWDFDPAESVKEKFGKFFEVKGVRGIRKLVKEIAITAATGQHENELVGTAKIPLKVSLIYSSLFLNNIFFFFILV